jgi:hypothetical protein
MVGVLEQFKGPNPQTGPDIKGPYELEHAIISKNILWKT